MPAPRLVRRLRSMPHKARVRMLFVTLGAIAVALVVLWALTFRIERSDEKTRFYEDIGTGISESFNNPAYGEAFGRP